jgi:translation initiation factor IF-2
MDGAALVETGDGPPVGASHRALVGPEHGRDATAATRRPTGPRSSRAEQPFRPVARWRSGRDAGPWPGGAPGRWRGPGRGVPGVLRRPVRGAVPAGLLADRGPCRGRGARPGGARAGVLALGDRPPPRPAGGLHPQGAGQPVPLPAAAGAGRGPPRGPDPRGARRAGRPRRPAGPVGGRPPAAAEAAGRGRPALPGGPPRGGGGPPARHVGRHGEVDREPGAGEAAGRVRPEASDLARHTEQGERR